MARWFVNPRKRRAITRRGEARPRVRVSGSTFVLGRRSPWKGTVRRVNPFIREVGMLNPIFANPRRRHRRRFRRARGWSFNAPIIGNPRRRGRRGGRSRSRGGSFGFMSVVKDPMGVLTQGAVGSVAAFLSIAVPNWLLPFPGTDIMSKVLRALTRAAAGGLLLQFGRGIVPGSQTAMVTGVTMAVGGSFLLDLLGTRVVLGAGDVAQTPGQLLSGFSTGLTGYGAYTRPMGAYTRGMGSIYGAGSRGFVESGIY